MNIARLMTTYNFEIEELPDNLKCAQCKLVLKDACQVPCGCRFCRNCFDELIERGGEFCPGESEDCGESPLTRFTTDYVANKSISRLTVKCPHGGCMHRCQLSNMEEHLRECPRTIDECPFRELGCTQDKLAAEEMGGHLQQDTRKHSEILIGMIVNINRDIEMLKHELELKDEQNRSIMDQLMHVQNENKLMKNDIKLIKEENETLGGRGRISSQEIEQEVTERREDDGLDSASGVIDHVDREIVAFTGLIGSNEDVLADEVLPGRSDIGSIYQDLPSQSTEISYVNLPVQPKPIHDSCEYLVKYNVLKSVWGWGGQQWSRYFYGTVKPYYYRLGCKNYGRTDAGKLCIKLRLYVGLKDNELPWPFEAKVSITVEDIHNSGASHTLSQQCRINRDGDSDLFEFTRWDLIDRGFNLTRGVRVSCTIVYGANS